ATHVASGTDVNFGALTRKLIHHLETENKENVLYNRTVTDINRLPKGSWAVNVKNEDANRLEHLRADVVFMGAGGQAIPLLQDRRLPESKALGGCPISGEFLMCTNKEIVNKHHAKVYGKEPKVTPPMTVPHLDRRHIDNKDILLFGPFAGFGPKFLKQGSNTDLVKDRKSVV